MEPAISLFGWSISADIYSWVILPVIIFFARVCDVSLGTMRIIMVSRGKRSITPILGFAEVFIWIVAIGQIVQHLHSITSFIGYAAGFAAGNFIGMAIEDKLALGRVIVRTFLPHDGDEIVRELRELGFGVTVFSGEGVSGEVKLIFTIIERKNLHEVVEVIHRVNPKAFLSVEDVRAAEEGIFPSGAFQVGTRFSRRKGK